jgi:hypothetical protein
VAQERKKNLPARAGRQICVSKLMPVQNMGCVP